MFNLDSSAPQVDKPQSANRWYIVVWYEYDKVGWYAVMRTHVDGVEYGHESQLRTFGGKHTPHLYKTYSGARLKAIEYADGKDWQVRLWTWRRGNKAQTRRKE